MAGVTLTCDRQDGLRRAAVWQGKELRDLYLDRLDQPDLTGAIVGAKVARLVAGEIAAWCEDGQGRTIYVEKLGTVRSGDYVTLKLVSPPRHGKAWGGVVAAYEGDGRLGLLVEPPRVWERALADLKGERPSALVFSDREEHGACLAWLERHEPSLLRVLTFLEKETPHPEIDEAIDRLREPLVPLAGGGSLVIEETEALAAIDVNSGEAKNSLSVNLAAVKEIARQMRLRNLSGILVADLLKIKTRVDVAKILNAAKKAVADDPVRVEVFGITKLGLLEMTRQRRGMSLSAILGEGG